MSASPTSADSAVVAEAEKDDVSDKPLGRNAERAAATRARIMCAVIDILDQQAFSALSNSRIVASAGVSSGAVMHHFPTRADLLAETVRFAYNRLCDWRAAQLETFEPGLPRFRAVIDLAWATARKPEGIAVNEIRISARSNEALATAVRPALSSIANDYGRFIGRLVRAAGMEPTQEVQGLSSTAAMALRSLSIDRMTNPSPQMVENVLLSLRTMREDLIAAQLGESVRIDPHICNLPTPDDLRKPASDPQTERR